MGQSILMSPIWPTYFFNQLVQALSWIMSKNYAIKHHIHYLDDYFLVAPVGSNQCARDVTTMLNLCHRLGILVAEDKLEGPGTSITFLGILIDSIKQKLALPTAKLEEIQALLESWHLLKNAPNASSSR